jgi:hypothetical protein
MDKDGDLRGIVRFQFYLMRFLNSIHLKNSEYGGRVK